MAAERRGGAASARRAAGGGWPLRVWVAMLVGAIAAPLCILWVWNTSAAARGAEDAARREVAAVAHQAAEETALFVQDTRAVLQRLAQRPDIGGLDPARCPPLFESVRDLFPRYTNMVSVDASGRGVCAGLGLVAGVGAYADFPWVQEALQGEAFTLGPPQLGRTSRQWVVVAASPVRGPDGAVRGVISVGIGLERFPVTHFQSAHRAHDIAVAIVDRAGRVVAHSTRREQIGREAGAWLRPLLDAGTARGAVHTVAEDGVGHLAAAVAVDGAPWTVVALHRVDDALALVRATFVRTMAIGAAILLAVLASAWVLVRRLLRPVRALAGAAEQVAHGARGVRLAPDGPREIARIAVNFNEMIARRERDEAQLRESEQRFRRIADAAPVMVWMADEHYVPRYFNVALQEFLGLPIDEVVARGPRWGIHPEDAERVLAQWADALKRQTGGTCEYRRLRADGTYRWLDERFAPRVAEDGTFLGIIGAGLDVTERVVAQQRIGRLTALYGALSHVNESIARGRHLPTLLETICGIVVRETGLATAVIALTDGSGTTLRTAAAAGDYAAVFRRYSAPADEPPDGPPRPGSLALQTDAPVVSNRRATDPRLRPIDHDGVRAAMHSSAVFPLRAAGGGRGVLAVYARQEDYFDDELVGLLRVLADDTAFALDSHADRTRRDAAEDALRHLNAELEQRVAERTRSLEAANRELEAFSYSVSHDLRAPLRSIGGFAALLQEGWSDRLDAEARGHLERVKAASLRMSRLIDDLLDLSRIARHAIVCDDIDLSRLAQEIVDDLAQAAPERRVDVRIAPGLRAWADPGLARIALANLIGNAWKFTGRTEGARIDVEAAPGGGIVVRDNGAGFDMAYAGKLYAPFQRLHADREYPGTGIGLAIVRRIVGRHGGEIAARAAPGEGAAFTFTLGRAGPPRDATS